MKSAEKIGMKKPYIRERERKIVMKKKEIDRENGYEETVCQRKREKKMTRND